MKAFLFGEAVMIMKLNWIYATATAGCGENPSARIQNATE